MSDLQTMSATARQLSNDLFDAEPVRCSEQALRERMGQPVGQSCITKEEERSLDSGEKFLGWSKRPFSAYNPAKLCRGCCAYWHAERAAQLLFELHCLARKEKALAKSRK
jgi:hypothetical protein